MMEDEGRCRITGVPPVPVAINVENCGFSYF